jgi:hypothetical protein
VFIPFDKITKESYMEEAGRDRNGKRGSNRRANIKKAHTMDEDEGRDKSLGYIPLGPSPVPVELNINHYKMRGIKSHDWSPFSNLSASSDPMRLQHFILFLHFSSGYPGHNVRMRDENDDCIEEWRMKDAIAELPGFCREPSGSYSINSSNSWSMMEGYSEDDPWLIYFG